MLKNRDVIKTSALKLVTVFSQNSSKKKQIKFDVNASISEANRLPSFSMNVNDRFTICNALKLEIIA